MAKSKQSARRPVTGKGNIFVSLYVFGAAKLVVNASSLDRSFKASVISITFLILSSPGMLNQTTWIAY